MPRVVVVIGIGRGIVIGAGTGRRGHCARRKSFHLPTGLIINRGPSAVSRTAPALFTYMAHGRHHDLPCCCAWPPRRDQHLHAPAPAVHERSGERRRDPCPAAPTAYPRVRT